MAQQDPIIEAAGPHNVQINGQVKVEALRGINLAVARGEMVAIMGPAGCDKTTLLNRLSGLDDFDGGEVRIAGTPLRDTSDTRKTEYRADRSGGAPQGDRRVPSATLAWDRRCRGYRRTARPIIASGGAAARFRIG